MQGTLRLLGTFSLYCLLIHLFIPSFVKQYLWSIYLRPWTVLGAKAFTVKSLAGTAMTMAHHMSGTTSTVPRHTLQENFPVSPFITPGSIL